MPLQTLRIPLELDPAARPEVLRAVQLSALARAAPQRQGPGAAEEGSETVSGLLENNLLTRIPIFAIFALVKDEMNTTNTQFRTVAGCEFIRSPSSRVIAQSTGGGSFFMVKE